MVGLDFWEIRKWKITRNGSFSILEAFFRNFEFNIKEGGTVGGRACVEAMPLQRDRPREREKPHTTLYVC